MKEKSIKKNFAFNLVYQLLILIIPIIVTPYISRVLGVSGIGEYSYASSIVAYFVLFATLGTATYGQRTIGYNQQDPEGRSRAFWEIFILRVGMSFITLGAYAVYAFIFAPQAGRVVCIIFALNIVNVIFDVTWFMQGMEEFGKTTLISIIFRLLNLASVFLFVKTESDLWKYTLISVGYSVLGNMIIWVFIPRYVCKVKGVRPFKDIKSILQLFLPTIAIQVYTVVDKSMIGWLTEGYTENGYYEQAEKIVKMALTVVTALGTVTIPRISRTFKEGNIEEVKRYVYRSYRYVWLTAIPMTCGLIVVASIFVPIFFGAGYEKCALLIPILGALTILIGLSNVSGMQYFVPTGKQNVLTFTVVVGAVVNIALNAALIPFYASMGAAIATLVAEFSVTLTGLIYIKRKKLFELKPIFTCCWKYVISGGVMTGFLFLIKYFLPVRAWALVVLILAGIVIYVLMVVALRDKFALEMLSKFKDMILRIFKRKKVQEVADAAADTLNGGGDAAPQENEDAAPQENDGTPQVDSADSPQPNEETAEPTADASGGGAQDSSQ